MLGILRQRAAVKLNHASGLDQGIRAVALRAFSSSTKEMTVRDALNSALDEEMSADPNVFVMGEEVSTYDESFPVSAEALDSSFCLLIGKAKDMLCAIAELESGRHPLATTYNKKSDEVKMGIMQILPKTAEWVTRELGYRTYEVAEDSKVMYKPFLNVYLAATYLKWLSHFDQKERSEEFMIRAYKGGTKKATHKSTLLYWKKYLFVKESLPSRKAFGVDPSSNAPSYAVTAVSQIKGPTNATWDSRTSPEDMEEMWRNPDVNKEWTHSGEKKGKVRFSYDVEKHPYLSRVELKVIY